MRPAGVETAGLVFVPKIRGHPPAGRAGIESEKMSGASRHWTPEEEEDRLRNFVEANRSLSFVAKELKRTESAVAGRAYNLGLRFGRPKTRGLNSTEARCGSTSSAIGLSVSCSVAAVASAGVAEYAFAQAAHAIFWPILVALDSFEFRW